MVSDGIGWEFPEELSLKTERVQTRSPNPIALKQEHKAKAGQQRGPMKTSVAEFTGSEQMKNHQATEQLLHQKLRQLRRHVNPFPKCLLGQNLSLSLVYSTENKNHSQDKKRLIKVVCRNKNKVLLNLHWTWKSNMRTSLIAFYFLQFFTFFRQEEVWQCLHGTGMSNHGIIRVFTVIYLLFALWFTV